MNLLKTPVINLLLVFELFEQHLAPTGLCVIFGNVHFLPVLTAAREKERNGGPEARTGVVVSSFAVSQNCPEERSHRSQCLEGGKLSQSPRWWWAEE